MFPLKLEKLHSQVLPEVLPKKLVFRTPYFNFVRELASIIQRLKLLLDKDLISKLYIFTAKFIWQRLTAFPVFHEAKLSHS